MTLNRLALCVCSVVSFSVGLIGCQSSIVKDNSTPTNSMVTGPSTSVPVSYQPIINTEKLEEIVGVANETVTEANTLQWASHYQWQLAHVKDQQGYLVNINTANPITLAIAPSSLSLSQGCQHFSIDFGWMDAPPFEYGSDLRKKPSDCKKTSNDKMGKGDIEALFPKNGILKLGITLSAVAKNEPNNTQMAPKNLMVKIENGNTLMFTGKPIAFKKPTGLPIDKALLERYDWELKSAVRNTFDDKGKVISRQSISHFYHPEFSVSLRFRGYDDSQYASFNSNCNGVGGPYILMTDHTLLVGSGMQTVMGCGVTGNRIENELSKLVSNSKSTLSLSLQPSSLSEAQSNSQANFPHYNLLQTMETGETLIWKNEVKKTP
ncbi:META domain-containing protein [Psychrobacter cryohalolentis]|uniref:META domain-containing protein n=1 Tax=Psychrobacter sp. D2 TaxID=2759702 RepID=UPI0015E5DB74|nr:META domain-containing protein [Psychrobacter sp. D2]MBA2057077.1 META domain-containing protein [Psychrobacter sp. D2]